MLGVRVSVRANLRVSVRANLNPHPNQAALNEAKEMLDAAVSAREEAQREVEELRRQHKDQGEEMIAAIETWEAALRDEEEARLALAAARLPHPDPDPLCLTLSL